MALLLPFSSTLLSHPTSFLCIVNADNTKLFFSPIDTHTEACTSACRADICSWMPANHINLNAFFLLQQIPTFVEALSFTDSTAPSPAQTTKNLGVKSHTMQLQPLFFSCCPNSIITCLYYNSLLAGLPTDLSPASTTHTVGYSLSHFHPH